MRKTRKVLFVVVLSIIMIMSQATGIVAFAESSNESSPPQQTETIVETQLRHSKPKAVRNCNRKKQQLKCSKSKMNRIWRKQ